MSSKHSLLLLSKQKQQFKYISTLFPANIVENAPYIDNLHCSCLNSPANLTNFINNNPLLSTSAKFLKEGLIKTYPTHKFIQAFEKLVNDKVSATLKSLTFADVGLSEYSNNNVFMFVDKTEEHDEIADQIAIVVPIYSKDANEFNAWLNNKLETLYIYGYMLTSIEKLKHDLLPEIDLLVIQFEAAYSAMKFKLADVLLHVAPLKYFEKIKKNGLVPKAKSAEFKYNDRVYLFNQCKESLAISYGKYKAKDMNDNGFCIFKIQKNNLENFKNYKNGKLRFYVDNAFETENGVQAIFTYNNVPLELIDDVCLVYDGPKFDKFRVVKFKVAMQ